MYHDVILIFFVCTRRSQRDVVESYPSLPLEMATNIAKLEISLKRSVAKWKIVYGHHPAFTVGRGHSYEADTLRSDYDLHNMFVRAGVDLYLTGHEHAFQYHCDRGVHHLIGGASCRSGFYGGRDRNIAIDWYDSSLSHGFLDITVSSESICCKFINAVSKSVLKEVMIRK